MKKVLSVLSILVLFAGAPAYAGADHDHAAPASDDHSTIKALDVAPDEAVTALEAGLADLAARAEANDAEGLATSAWSLMSAVKTLEAADPSQRQAAALKQLDQQLDAVKHAAEDKEFEQAKSSVTKASSALKLYKAVQ